MKLTPLKIILIGALATLLAASCTKEYKAPIFWDVKIKHTLTATGLNVEAIAYPNTDIRYVWHISDIRYEGKTAVAPLAARYYIQLSVIDNKGNSISEYLTVIR